MFTPTFAALQIVSQMAALQSALEKLDRSSPGGWKGTTIAHHARVFLSLMRVMTISVFSTVFATSYSGSLHRSALFLLVFLVVHMGGNLTAFFGRDAYNTYGHHINSMPFIRVIELYLLVRLPRTTLGPYPASVLVLSIILGPL